MKLQLDRERLRQYEQLVKVGIPGMGYVRFDANSPWPPMLQQKPVSELPWKPTGSSEATSIRSYLIRSYQVAGTIERERWQPLSTSQ